MLIIGNIPDELKKLIGAATARLSVPQKRWAAAVTLAMAVSFGKRNVKSLACMVTVDRSRSSMNDFFTESPWIAAEFLRAGTLYTLEQMQLQPGERIGVIVDGSPKAKRGAKMDALMPIKEAGSKEWRKGHRILLCYLRVRGVMLPWAVDIYLSKKFLASDAGKALRQRFPQIRFRTINEMAADIIQRLPAEWKEKFKVMVLMDSGFCNPTACGAVRAAGFHYTVAAQASRTLVKCTRNGSKGRKVVLKHYAVGRLRYQGQNVALSPKRAGGKRRRFRLAETVGTLNGLGMVKVVFSRRQSDGSVLCLVCSDLAADSRQIAEDYGWRWEIEVTTKGLKQHLGLGQYQCRYYEGMIHHLHLSLLAHLALTVAELNRRGPETYKTYAMLQIPSIRALQTRLRRDVWRDLLEKLRPKCTDPDLIERLERALQAA